jgi:hypothetical protein
MRGAGTGPVPSRGGRMVSAFRLWLGRVLS